MTTNREHNKFCMKNPDRSVRDSIDPEHDLSMDWDPYICICPLLELAAQEARQDEQATTGQTQPVDIWCPNCGTQISP